MTPSDFKYTQVGFKLISVRVCLKTLPFNHHQSELEESFQALVSWPLGIAFAISVRFATSKVIHSFCLFKGFGSFR